MNSTPLDGAMFPYTNSIGQITVLEDVEVKQHTGSIMLVACISLV